MKAMVLSPVPFRNHEKNPAKLKPSQNIPHGSLVIGGLRPLEFAMLPPQYPTAQDSAPSISLSTDHSRSVTPAAIGGLAALQSKVRLDSQLVHAADHAADVARQKFAEQLIHLRDGRFRAMTVVQAGLFR
jgi:hypothetical protein